MTSRPQWGAAIFRTGRLAALWAVLAAVALEPRGAEGRGWVVQGGKWVPDAAPAGDAVARGELVAPDANRPRISQSAGAPPRPEEQEDFHNGNIDTVYNGPPKTPTTWTVREPVMVMYLNTYHHNNGRGATPGRIGLKHEDGTVYGPWQTKGAKQGSSPNRFWYAEPKVVVKPGTYTVLDSSPETWSQNVRSGRAGQALIRIRRLSSAERVAHNFAPGAKRVHGADRVAGTDGKVLLGTLTNRSFPLDTAFGTVNVATRDLAGIVPIGASGTKAWLLLADGQAVIGELPDEPLTLRLADGKTVEVPMGKLRECGLRAGGGAAASAATASTDAMTLLLGTGERLTCTGPVEDLAVETAYGKATIPAGRIARIERLGDKAGTCKLTLRGGSQFYGKPSRKTLTIQLALGARASVEARQVITLSASKPAAARKHDKRAVIIMGNGDRLIGELPNKPLTVRTSYGTVQVWPASAASITFGANPATQAVIRMWDGATIIGEVKEKELPFATEGGGLTLRLPTARVETICRDKPLPPPEIARKVRKLVTQLKAESFQARQAATQSLVEFGPAIVPLLERHAGAKDAETRLRIAEILAKLGARR